MSNSFVNALDDTFNYTRTENGALAHRTTSSKALDLFAHIGAYRTRTDDDCIVLFQQAFDEDRDLALKCLFWGRDVRGGAGERRFFRVCFHWLCENYPTIAAKNMKYITEYGRVDDLYCLVDTPLEEDMFKYLKKIVDESIKELELL